jgi:hypothetical protein
VSPSFLFSQFMGGLTTAMFLFLIASGLSLVFGVMRVLNFAHGSFYMIGAYIAWQVVQWLQPTPERFWPAVLEDADRPQLGLGTRHHSLHRVGIGDICLDCNDASAGGRNFGGGCFRLRRAGCIVDADRRASRGQRSRDRSADAAGASSNDRHLVSPVRHSRLNHAAESCLANTDPERICSRPQQDEVGHASEGQGCDHHRWRPWHGRSRSAAVRGGGR